MCFFYGYGDHRGLHVLTPSVPSRRASDLVMRDEAPATSNGTTNGASAAKPIRPSQRSGDDAPAAAEAVPPIEQSADPITPPTEDAPAPRAAAPTPEPEPANTFDPFKKEPPKKGRTEEHTSEIQSLMHISY